MPTIEGGGKLRGPRRRTKRRSVSLLHDVEPPRKRGRRPASERNGETVNHVVEPARASGSWFHRLEPFGKDPPRAGLGVAEEAAGPQNQRYPHASGWNIRQPSPILAVHAVANASARRASANTRRASYRDHKAVVVFHPRSQRRIRAEQAPKRQTHPWLRSPTRIRAEPAPRIHQI